MRTKNSKKWSKEDLEEVRKNYENENLVELSKRLGCSVKAIMHKAKKLGVRKSLLGENNPNWKGDNVGYYALHQWIKSRKDKPSLCEECKKLAPYDLANISQEYKRDINDWEWLCRSCHMHKDNRINKLMELHIGKKITEEQKIKIGLGLRKAYKEGRRSKKYKTQKKCQEN
jgi:hypothetical protein